MPLEADDGKEVTVEIFGDHCVALESGADSSEWFSTFLGIKCRAVFMPEISVRLVDPEYASDQARTSFTEGFSFLQIGERSLGVLNSRLQKPLQMRRFRPNHVVKESKPYSEDSWGQIRIGSVAFQVAKACGRCRVTTVDPDRGEFSGKDPLKTLAGYRYVDGETRFGQNLIHLQPGFLEVGDEVGIIDSSSD